MTSEKIDELAEAAFDKTKNEIAVCYVGDNDDYFYLEDVFKPLLQSTARFVESYTYDLIITWQSIVKAIEQFHKSKSKTCEREIFLLGMYKNGCHSTGFIMSNLEEHDHNIYSFADSYYRRIYAVEVRRDKNTRYGDEPDNYITSVTLKDVQSSIASVVKTYIQETRGW